MNMEQFSAIAQALGNVHRARIVEFLSCGPLCACELQPFFGFTQPTLSNHMRVLRQAGVVLAEQVGPQLPSVQGTSSVASWLGL